MGNFDGFRVLLTQIWVNKEQAVRRFYPGVIRRYRLSILAKFGRKGCEPPLPLTLAQSNQAVRPPHTPCAAKTQAPSN